MYSTLTLRLDDVHFSPLDTANPNNVENKDLKIRKELQNIQATKINRCLMFV